ncbi:hypothetical protein [Arthrobacter sp. UYEF20]|uniref:hypothetical protein n=1 Tax=Arthrobacter sp. UYEF20 TaxID=1756363 RepID=UPI003390A9F5
MSEHTEPGPYTVGPWRAHLADQRRRREDLTARQMRTIGQRRADAEGKLARHLKEAHHRPEVSPPQRDD